MRLSRLIAISRPRFWSYLAGTYIVGYALAAGSISEFTKLSFWYTLFFFLIPANFFLYAINDYFDKDVDRENPRKGRREVRLMPYESTQVFVLAIFALLFMFPLLLYLNFHARLILLAFIALAVFYSAPPVRFKTMPFFDTASNILYILPGFIGYVQLMNPVFSLTSIIALGCWPAAMHLFSAIPDIESDKRARIETTATYLGRSGSLIACIILWFIFAWYATSQNPYFVVSFMYPAIPFYLLYHTEKNVESVYWKFPVINTLMGALLFVFLLVWKFRLHL